MLRVIDFLFLFTAETITGEEAAAHRLGAMVKKRHKPIFVHSLYRAHESHALDLLRYYDIPIHNPLDILCKCVASLCKYGNYLKSYHAITNFVFNRGAKAKKDRAKIIENTGKEGRRVLFEHEAK